MKISTFSLLVLALCLYSGVNAQTKKAQDENKSSTATKKVTLPFEKVYLHLDRPSYVAGEDIWFKAYLIDATNSTLFDNSNLLYVELISPDSKIVQRDQVRLSKGTGNGDFHLKDSIAAGRYQIRAYTNWMRNFGEAFIFKKEIQVESFIAQSKADAKTKPAAKQNTATTAKENKVDVQFFPESGSLIENVYSNVAFKAIDQDGKGCQVSGLVFSSSGDTVSAFTSAHLGMGSFNMLPKPGLTYYAEGKSSQGLAFKLQLPVALKTGYNFKVFSSDNGNLKITIRTNQETMNLRPEEELLVVGTAHSSLCASASLKMKNLLVNVFIPKKDFPEGITMLTLYDKNYKPYGQRLVFVHQDNHLKVSLTSDKPAYAPREKVTLNLSVKDSANNPVSANLSLAAVDASIIRDTTKYASSIGSYFLLESEIRGNIEHPGYYFDKNNPDRLKALDLLMQTQGWRDFLWKYLADSTIKLNYDIEKGIVVSGKLRKLFINKPLPNANISLGLFGDSPLITIAQTDSTGRFVFGGLDFAGQRTMVLTATNKEHNTKGWLQLDSLRQAPVPVNFHWMETPKAKAEEIAFKQEAELRNNIMKKYKLTDTIQLNEVVVKARKTATETKDDGHFRMYGNPDFSLQVTDENSGYSDIFQLLQGRVAGLMISGAYPNLSFSMRGGHGTPLFLLDGVEVDIDMIGSLPVADVDKIEVLKDIGNLALFGSRGGNGVISVFTKRGYVAGAKPVFHSVNTKLNGFYQARVFYSPRYDVPSDEASKPDLRSTIFWAPNINTDANGTGTVTFFNGDKQAPVFIKAEGVSQNGDLLTIKSSYIVK